MRLMEREINNKILVHKVKYSTFLKNRRGEERRLLNGIKYDINGKIKHRGFNPFHLSINDTHSDINFLA